MYGHRIGLYLSFHLTSVLNPLVHGWFQNLQTSEITFADAITPLNVCLDSSVFILRFTLVNLPQVTPMILLISSSCIATAAATPNATVTPTTYVRDCNVYMFDVVRDVSLKGSVCDV